MSKEICGATHPGLEWLGNGEELICSLPEGHRGYCWGGRDGMQPFPRRRGFIHLPGPEQLPNAEIGIRPMSGFCNNRHPVHGECDLRWHHKGAHARRGAIWRAT
jgi:hypothetical protein